MKALYGEVTEVKKIISRQVARLHIEFPVEAFKDVVQLLDDQRVLVTIAPSALASVPFGIVEAEEADDAPEPEAAVLAVDHHPGAKLAQALYRSGWFFNPRVLEVLGTDVEYRAWITQQPSVLSGTYDYVELTTGGGLEQTTIAHHLNRADSVPARDGVTPNKPAFFCVPLRDHEHKALHQFGEAQALATFAGIQCTTESAREWFDRRRGKLVTEWAKQKLYLRFAITSLRDLKPSLLRQWAEAHGIAHTLPSVEGDAE